MTDRTFLDTNILLYAEDARVPAKQERAREVIAALVTDRSAVISTQVLQEFFVIATKKLKLTAEAAQESVASYAQLDVVIVQLSAHHRSDPTAPAALHLILGRTHRSRRSRWGLHEAAQRRPRAPARLRCAGDRKPLRELTH